MISRSHSTIFNFWIMSMFSRKWQKQGKQRWDILRKTIYNKSTIAIPDNKDVADKFEKLISPIFKQIVKLQEEISNLIKQRDELLPLLMNGQITIE